MPAKSRTDPDDWTQSQYQAPSTRRLPEGAGVGHGAIVAAKSVVTHDVPPYAIVAGNPAKVVKMRFDEFTVRRLLAAAWWDWPADKVSRNLDAIRGADISRLEAAA